MTTATAPPCTDCQTTGGYMGGDRVTPNRTSGEPFGVDGDLCHRCYAKHYKRFRATGKTLRGRRRDKGTKQAPLRVDPLEHRGLVYRVAMKFQGRGADLDDLAGWGQIGLLNACRGFNPEAGVKFSTYAAKCIKHTILREIANKVPLIHLPEYLTRLIWQGVTSLPSPKKNARLQDALAVRGRKIVPEQSLGQPLDTLAYARGDEDAEQDEAADEAVLGVVRAILTLPVPLRRVLRLRYGLTGHEPLNQREIADRFGVTRQRVQQLEREAIAELKRQMKGAA